MKTENRKQYSNTELYLGNLVIIFWIILGTFAFSLFISWAAIVFFAAAGFLIFYELGKHGCVTCYFCKTCTVGMGKLPYLFFKKAGTANVNKRAMEIFPFVYLLLSVVPITLVTVSLVQGFAFYKVLLLAALVVFSGYTGVVRRKNLL